MIYLDYNATTPLDPRVLEAMLPYFRERFGNAASRHHELGKSAAAAVETAREQAAAVIGADPAEIYWTSGATESDNLAIKGVAVAPAYLAKGNHIVTAGTEHRAVLDPCEHLESRGFKITYLGVDRRGMIDLEKLANEITPKTFLVSLMHANNETGVVHPIDEIGALCRKNGALFHTDATQTFGKELIDVESDCIDLLSASAHKLCGPKGAGLLYVRKRNPRVRCEPILHGGGHERGLRSGTLNVPAIVGFGLAAELCRKEMPAEQPRFRILRDRLEQGLRSRLPDVETNGHPERRLANTTNLSFAGIESEALMKALPDLALSSSSACTSALLQPSYVLGAIGCSEEAVRGSVRFSLGRFTTEEEIDRAVSSIVEAVKMLRER
jgi:cysteine desulfurase